MTSSHTVPSTPLQVRQDDFSDLADVRATGAGAPPSMAPQVPTAAAPSHNATAAAQSQSKTSDGRQKLV